MGNSDQTDSTTELGNRSPIFSVWVQVVAFTAASILIVPLLLLDIYTPRGIADWQSYIVVVLLALVVPGRWHVIAIASLCSLAIVAGYFLSHQTSALPPWISQVNRSVAIAILWGVAIGGLHVRRVATLKAVNEKLLREIDERRAAEELVREQASLLDVTHDAISVYDMEGRITYWNRGAELLYGWTAAEVVGQNAQHLIEGLQESADHSFALADFLHRGAHTHEVRQKTRDGQIVLVHERWSLVRKVNNQPLARLVVGTDVTESRRLERLVLQNQRLDSIGRLTGGIAHDFNNLLTPMMMAVRILQEDRPADERVELLRTLQIGAERGAEMIRKLLRFARGSETPLREVALGEIIWEFKEIITHSFPKSIEIEIRIEKDLATILADATEISQVLMNLCVNARDAMPEGGRLTIEATNVVLNEEDISDPAMKPGPYVQLSVEDTGTGIAREVIDRVFEPFFTTKAMGEGTGLGLSTVMGIVRSQGGMVRAANGSIGGARFILRWPSCGSIVSISDPRPEEPSVSEGGLVLVVDDEAPILVAARSGLESFGYQVATAQDGRAAVDVYRQHNGRVQVVILDVMMPGMDGAATLAELRRVNPGCRVVLTSGLRLSEALAEEVQSGVVGFLAKPYTLEQLTGAVARFAAIDKTRPAHNGPERGL